MKRVLLAAFITLSLPGLSPGAMPGNETATPYEWEGIPRVVAMGDVHGGYDTLISLLQGTGIAGEDLGWIGGKDHLVMLGDILDRLPGDRLIMDLLRRLQKESAAAGGRVHVLLGNHEVMNMIRDLRYVSHESYKSFAADEDQKERRAAKRRFLGGRPSHEPRSVTEAAFEERYPEGYFARLRAFNPDGEYGRWLLGNPVVVKVNGAVFVHGGLTEDTARLGLAGINRGIHDELKEHLEQRAVLEKNGRIDTLMDFAELRLAAKGIVKRRASKGPEDALRLAAATMVELNESHLLTRRGPLWYRGNSLEDERIERSRVEESLELLQARVLVVAHSMTRSRLITSRFSGRLYRVDHGMLLGSSAQALVFTDGEALAFDLFSNTLVEPKEEPPQGEGWSARSEELDGKRVERFLATADVVTSRYLGRGSTHPELLELRKGDVRRRAIFKTVDDASGHSGESADRYQHEVAAHDLDRKLGLGMVPLTLVRKIGGRTGSIQSWIEEAVDQESVDSYDLQARDPGMIQEQMARARVFDTLIGNRDRKPSDILYLLDESKIMLIDHSRAFHVSQELGTRKSEPLSVEPRLRQALSALDEEWLRARLGNLLSEDQIEAVLVRRDRILQHDAQAHTE